MPNTPEVERRRITDFRPDPANANAGTERGLRALDDSLAEVGIGRSVVADKNGYLIAGNKTQERAVDSGFDEAIVVHTTGNQLVVVQRDDLDLLSVDDLKARKLAYYDNRAGELDLEWDAARIAADLQAGIDLSALWGPDELVKLLADTDTGTVGDIADALDFPIEVPDALFPSDNEWGVPTLDLKLQASALHMPAAKWGTIARAGKMDGTYHFYTDDYKFTALWGDPAPIVRSGCRAIIEPNLSTNPQQPKALVLWLIYQKRWLARWWQQYGIQVIVDLNIEREFFDLALLGVPRGWRAYANRGDSDDLAHLDEAYALAQARAGDGVDLLYVVYGGNRILKSYCQERGWLWLSDQTDRARMRGERDGAR